MNTDICKKVIGMTQEDAEKLIKLEGLTSRIVSLDGEFFMVTADYNMSRVNLNITGGIVTGANKG